MKQEHELAALDAYLDQQLSAAELQRVEQHLLDCAPCRQALDGRQLLRQRLLEQRVQAPAALRARLAAALESPTPLMDQKRVKAPSVWGGVVLVWGRLTLACCLAAAVGAAACWWLLQPRVEDPLLQQVLTSHVRSLMVPEHLLDVVSTDRHTVKPWFNGKLNYAPPVADFAAEGFPLAGGRLEYLDGRAVATLIYRYRLHTVNVYVWPEAGDEKSVRDLTRDGYSIVVARHRGMSYWLISDAEGVHLHQLAQLLDLNTGQTPQKR